MKYAPHHQLGETPNLVVDGAATLTTVLTLSHWPHSGTPAILRDDLSAQIVFRYLDRPDLHVRVDAVSNNHFDEDGLVGVWAVLHPDEAQARRELLVDVASAGDFGTFTDRTAARVAFALSAYADPDTSPLGPSPFALPYPELVAVLFTELLPRLPEMCDDVARFRDLWEVEDSVLEGGQRALEAGTVAIEEVGPLDLAVVSIPEEWRVRHVHRFTQERAQALHPMAVHNSTRCTRVLLMQGRRYVLQQRYETWVQYQSRRLLPRVDLAPLAARLSEREREGTWRADGVDDITPALSLLDADESSIDPSMFRAEVERFLVEAPAAWDPYDRP
jgi:hypothetical protein